MNGQFNPSQDCRQRLTACFGDMPKEFLFISVDHQELFVIRDENVMRHFPVSTSAWGRGNRVNSFQTPTGIHTVAARIGAGAPKYAIFRHRISTGRIWRPGEDMENMILTRILRLRGEECGINLGPGIDSYERYIYIHGTNREDIIGTPFSHGCVCMKNDDILTLFDSVWEDMIVFID